MFTGRCYDDETGLYYYRARYYDYYTGRFLQTDPVGYSTGLNLYTYCGNNSINLIDPYGLFRWRTFFKGVAQCALGVVAVATAGPIIAVSGGVGTALEAAAAVGGLYSWSVGLANITMAFLDEPPVPIPDTLPGVMALPAGENASKITDITTTALTGDYRSGLGATATALQLASMIDYGASSKGCPSGSVLPGSIYEIQLMRP